MLESLGLVPKSSNMKFVCSNKDDGEVMFIEIIRDDDEPPNEGPNEGEGATTEGSAVEYFDTFPTRDELTYHKTLIIDPRLSQVVLGKPFVEISNMTHDPQEGVVRFTNGNEKVTYKIPHKIEQYNSLSSLEKKYTKLVYLRNEEDKRRGVEYVMSKILRSYKECLELGPEYLTGMEDEGEIKYALRYLDMKNAVMHCRRERSSLWKTICKDGLIYDQKKGTITFEKDDEKITFIMPHKMEASNHIDFKEINTDSIPPSVLESNDDRGKTYYSDSLTLGPEYKEDETISKEIRHLMKLKREAKRHKGEACKDV
ncbi:hypothetical protein Tco_1155230 [Tanacetum coccineum]